MTTSGDAIQPTTILDRLIDVTGRDAWQVRRKDSGGELVDDDAGETFRELAELVLSDVSVIHGAEEWLNSANCLSGNHLGLQVGQLDDALGCMSTVLAWLKGGKCSGFVVGYFSGVAMQREQIPEDMLRDLDETIATRPLLVLDTTIHADVSDRGFERIMNITARGGEDEALHVGLLAFGRWAKFLTSDQKRSLLETLDDLNNAGNRHALKVAFDLLVGWTRVSKKQSDPFDPLLRPNAVRLLLAAETPGKVVDDYDWKTVAEQVMVFSPADIAPILVGALLNSDHYNRERYAEELVRKLASSFPIEVMAALGPTVLDDEKGFIFHIRVFRGLFEAIGQEEVQRWIDANGELAARRVARHLIGPHLSEEGEPIIPPLTDWVLTTFDDNKEVFSEFCMGRHSGEVRVGHARDRHASVMQQIAPFVHHEKKWVRDWAKYERDSFEHEVKWDDQIEDEHKRTF